MLVYFLNFFFVYYVVKTKNHTDVHECTLFTTKCVCVSSKATILPQLKQEFY